MESNVSKRAKRQNRDYWQRQIQSSWGDKGIPTDNQVNEQWLTRRSIKNYPNIRRKKSFANNLLKSLDKTGQEKQLEKILFNKKCMCNNEYVSKELAEEIKKSGIIVNQIDDDKQRKNIQKRMLTEEIIQRFDEKFLSLYEWFDKKGGIGLRNEIRDFIYSEIGTLIDNFYKYEQEKYGAEDNSKM